MNAETWLRAHGIEPPSKRGPRGSGGIIAREQTQALPIVPPPAAIPTSVAPPAPTPPPSRAAMPTPLTAWPVPAPEDGATNPLAGAPPAVPASGAGAAPASDPLAESTVVLPAIRRDPSQTPTRRLSRPPG